jgi:lysophospholipase
MATAKTKTPPDFEPRFLEPEGWRWHSFTNPKGRKIRFGTVAPKSRIPDAVVICLQGLSEFTEKYFEVAHNLLDRNLSFWMMDWQGQGKSDRYLKNPHKRHSNGFDEDIADLHFFIMEYIKHSAVHPDVGRIPMVMLGHSMGANIGLHYLHRHPDTFVCAAFSAPLMGIKALKNIPVTFSSGLTGAFRTLCGQSYVLGGGDWCTRSEKMKAMLTSDPVRREVQDKWCLHDPGLQVGGVTFGWVHEANKSCMRFHRKNYLADIKTPCLLALAGEEHLTDNESCRKLAAAMPSAKIIDIAGARHEVLMERDELRNLFFHAFDDLLRVHKVKDKVKPF